MSFKIYTYLFFFLLMNNLLGQDHLTQAQKLFEDRRYDIAVGLLNNISTIDTDRKALELRGTCYFHLNQLDKAIYDFTASKKLGNDSPELFFNMGQCKQHLESFEEAIFFYKAFLSLVGDKHNLSYKAYLEMKNAIFCATVKDSSDILVQNFGDAVNTLHDELLVIQSPQFGNVYYLSNNSDLPEFQIESKSIDSLGQWSHSRIKPSGQMGSAFIQDVSPNGNGLVYINHDGKQRELKISCFLEGTEHTLILPGNIFSDAIDIQLVNRKTIAFASDREGGYGGFDLYTIRYENGIWQTAVNLGPDINSAHDERSPYLAVDQSSLYFSSNRPYCFGGYDIYHAIPINSKMNITNLGSTINSVGDDLGFKVCKDGNMSVFHSNRKSGFGGYDSYFAYMQNIHFKNYNDSLDLIYVQDYFNAVNYEKINEVEPLASDEFETLPEMDSMIAADTPKENVPVIIEEDINYSPIKTPVDLEYTLLYQDKQDLLNDVNKGKLDHWISYLKENMDRDIKLLAYTDYNEPGLPEFVQYNTFKRAYFIAQYMLDNGISEHRISIESLANNYPIVKKESAGKLNTTHIKYNKRIDLELVDKSKQTLSSYTLEELVPEYASDRRHEIFLSIREGLYYSIEISETNRLFKNAVLRLYNDIYIRKEDMSSKNKYYIGIYTKLEDAQLLLADLKNSSAPYAKMVAFFNGTPITPENIAQLKKNHPELSSFNL